MNRTKAFAAASCLGIASLALAPSAVADQWNKKTIITIGEAIQVPGKVLQPGKYVMKLLDSQSNRHIVQIFNEREDQLQTTILAIPNYADAYERNIAARAFDVARYCLFFGIPTGVGQVVSIRTLERQIRRLKASSYQELSSIAEELGHACSETPACAWSSDTAEPIAPTLAKHVDADTHRHLQHFFGGNLTANRNNQPLLLQFIH